MIIALLLCSKSFGQVYKIEKKEVRAATSWKANDVQGYITINDREISITEGTVIKGFLVDKVEPFGGDYMKYSCTDQNHKKVKIITVGFNKSKDSFKVLVSYPSKYYRYYLTRL